MKPFVCGAMLAASSAIIPTAANATMTINIMQVGPNVVATSSGSINIGHLGVQFTTPESTKGSLVVMLASTPTTLHLAIKSLPILV